jgi:hypothetical protein
MTTAKSMPHLPTKAESSFWLVCHDFEEHFALTNNSFLKSSTLRIDEFMGTILKDGSSLHNSKSSASSHPRKGQVRSNEIKPTASLNATTSDERFCQYTALHRS